ncbi:unnamed protein product [Thelazia callipaeda]|uniref:POT1PC domain-containing protein n=1 Tax=Thelazia callipaeda TaxID=103827 RepID=A0A158RBC0_THECL|nr:unnamed protein product [Thelazia callipaeda]
MVGRSTIRNRHHSRPSVSIPQSTLGSVARFEDRKRSDDFAGSTMQIHPVWPEMPQGQGELFFECTLFLYSVLALFLQYLNLYKTMWWLPKSYWHYSMKFHLINPYLLSCVGLLLGMRVTKCFWNTITELSTSAKQNGSKTQCFLWDIVEWAAVKTPMFTMVATSFLFSFSRVYFDYPFKSLLSFGHPVLFFIYLFYGDISFKVRCLNAKFWFLLNGGSTSELSKVTAMYRKMSPPTLIDIDSVVHMCSTNPSQIREEVSVLIKDLNLRLKHCFFSGLTTAYLSIFIPCVFTPQRSPSGLSQQMYIDILWVVELFCVVFSTSFSLYAAYLLPLQYCDLIHRCAAHLGKWERVDRTVSTTNGSGTSSNTATTSSNAIAHSSSSGSTPTTSVSAPNTVLVNWSEGDGLYADGTIVRHQNQMYRAVAASAALGVAAEPGDTDHSRFYRIGRDPVFLVTVMTLFQVILIGIQFWMLILTTDWQHIVNIYALVVDLAITMLGHDDGRENAVVVTKLKLHDGSLERSTKCVIYNEPTESFLDKIRKGQIIRIHRAKVKREFDREVVLYGKLKIAGFAVLLFSGLVNDNIAPVYQSSVKFTVTDDHEKKIESLRILFAKDQSLRVGMTSAVSDHLITSEDDLRGELVITENKINKKRIGIAAAAENVKIHRLNELVLGSYCNVAVQVISVFVSVQNSVILRCWDTTTVQRKLFSVDADSIQHVMCNDRSLEEVPKNYRCDVVLYEEHADFVKNNVKCGDIVLLVNLHVYHSKSGITLTMHTGGQHYNRSIIILGENDIIKNNLLQDISRFNAEEGTETMSISSEGQVIARNCEDIGELQQEVNAPVVGLFDRTVIANRQQIESTTQRLKRINALQLTWIFYCILNKKFHHNLHLELPFNLALRAAEFMVRQLLERLYNSDKNLFVKLVKLSNELLNTLLACFLTAYLNASCIDETISYLLHIDMFHLFENITCTKDITHGPETRNISNKSSEDDIAWDLLCSLLPGSVLKLYRWEINFLYEKTTKVLFVLLCNKCNLWHITSFTSLDITSLCPVCFKRGIEDSYLFLQRFVLFRGEPYKLGSPHAAYLLKLHLMRVSKLYVFQDVGGKNFYFLFPIQLLAFFLVDFPENNEEIAHRRQIMTDQQEKTFAESIQSRMLSKYKFALDEVIIRKIKGDTAIVEVCRLTFFDRV